MDRDPTTVKSGTLNNRNQISSVMREKIISGVRSKAKIEASA